MPNKSIDLPGQDRIVTLEPSETRLPGFVKATFQPTRDSQFAKTLASAYMKFTTDGQALMREDSAESFIRQAELHRDLAEDAREYLLDEVPFVYEDQQIQPLLLNFALFRLKQVSRRYYFATLQNQPKAIVDDLKSVVDQRQQEYDAVLAAM